MIKANAVPVGFYARKPLKPAWFFHKMEKSISFRESFRIFYFARIFKSHPLMTVQNVLVFPVTGNFRAGKYRLYLTYNTLGNDHFFKSSGNIQKQ